MGSIREWGLKIKLWLDQNAEVWGLPLLVVFLGLASFGLGRFSALEDARPAIAIHQAPMATNPTPMRMGGYVVASDTGTVFYLPWCAGAQKITIAKQRWFTTEKAAQAAGYRPAKNCKGLE